ncbi:MAG: TCR/Tet family MFS transporter [Nanoarchaeota archaeon]|nr:TCR/Tet family MFS transporter [Nanoarchaeota archaeon]
MNYKGLFSVFVTVFIDLVGVGLVIPILAPMFISGTLLPAESLQTRTFVLGLLIASYPFAQFFGAPILGALSDKHGRKKILMLSLVGTFVGYILSAIGIYYNDLTLLFVSRLIDGFTGGNISTALSAIADLSDNKEKARNFGLIGMAFGLGFIIGPYLGGKLSDPTIVSWFSFTTPYLFAASLTIINFLLVLAFFEETLKKPRHTPVSLMTGFKNIARAFSMTDLRVMFLVVFLFTFGFNFFTQFFQVFLIEKFSFTPSQIGEMFGYMGLFIALTQGILTRALSKRFKPQQILPVSLILVAIALSLLLIPTHVSGIYLVIPFVSIFNGISHPNVTAIISNLADRESQGEILGINQSIQSLGMALPPVISGIVAGVHFSLPIIVASLTTCVAWLVFILFFKETKEQFHEI